MLERMWNPIAWSFNQARKDSIGELRGWDYSMTRHVKAAAQDACGAWEVDAC